MIVFKKADELHSFLVKRKTNGFKTGFVPSMGALHKGHLSLIEASKKQNGITICSIFVNPAQFNDPKDFEKYPITLENDIFLLEKVGCDIVFLPSINEIYPDGNKNVTFYELGYLENILEGKYRPGHFQGVCRVMDRLLNIIQPTNLYLGQKDYQQCLVIKNLVEIIRLDTIININPTMRETSGLAMSSRNMRLNETEKKRAIRIYEALSLIKKGLKQGSLAALKEEAVNYLATENFKIDYIEIANAATLTTVEDWDGETALVALCAAFLHEVRLIDNLLLN